MVATLGRTSLLGSFLLLALGPNLHADDPPSSPSDAGQAGPRRADSSDAARAVRKAVMLILREDDGGFSIGTAFVISRTHRLVATNAHVADFFNAGGTPVWALPNGTSDRYRVEKVWYHPGLLRESDRSLVLSQDKAEGPVYPMSPDVAVMRLAAGGPELPEEATLARWEDLEDLAGQPVVMIGFPMYNTKDAPKVGELVSATIQEGIVNRVSNFLLKADSEPEDRQFVQHSAPNWGGFSGSPLALSDGRVVAINNSNRAYRRNLESTMLAMAIRIDCLWELIVHHEELSGLLDLGDPRGRVRTDRARRPDSQMAKFYRAIQLVREAEQLAWKGSYDEAIAKADEAIAVDPQLAHAYRCRAEARWFRCDAAGRGDPVPKKVEALKSALGDLVKAIELEPSVVSYKLDLIAVNNYLAALVRDPELYQRSIRALETIEGKGGLSEPEQARALQSRAAILYALGEPARAIALCEAALKKSPDDPFIYEDRATYLEGVGRSDLARADREKAEAIRRSRPTYHHP